MFVSTIDRQQLEDRLDPAFYAPLPLEADEWLAGLDPTTVVTLGRLAKFHASAFYASIAGRYSSHGVPFIRVGDVRTGTVSLTGTVFLPESVALGTSGLNTVEHPVLAITKGGSVGRVGITTAKRLYAISRDVIGLVPKDQATLGLLLFFLASVPGRAQVLRGASRQVQAHLTLERLRDVRIPAVGETGMAALHDAASNLRRRREEFEACRNNVDHAIAEIDPFAQLYERDRSYTVDRSDVLRVRMDARFYRPGFAAAHEKASAAGWEALGAAPWIQWPEDRWERTTMRPDEWLSYVPLAAIEPLACRIAYPQPVRVWAAPTRATWHIQANDVLVPSLLDCLDRVGLVSPSDGSAVCSSGFYVLRPRTIDQGLFLAAYLSSRGAKEQMERAGSGTRFRGITPDRASALLVPPVDAVSELPRLMRSVQAAAVALGETWNHGINLVHDLMGWSGSGLDVFVSEAIIDDPAEGSLESA